MRLIDVDALKDKVLKWLPSDPCGIEEKEFPFETDIVVSLMMEIEEAPSIDIVFCKDCVKRKYCCLGYIPTDDYGFCSNGERKDEPQKMGSIERPKMGLCAKCGRTDCDQQMEHIDNCNGYIEPQTEAIVCPIIEDDADYYGWLYADDIKRMKEKINRRLKERSE